MKKIKIALLVCTIFMMFGLLNGTAMATEEEELVLVDTPIYANSLQDGYLYSTPVYNYDKEIPVIQAGESWHAGLKQRLKETIQSYGTVVYVGDLGIPYDRYNEDNTYYILANALREVLDENPSFFYVSYISMYYHNYSNVIDIYIAYSPAFTDATGNVDQNKINQYNVALSKALSHIKSGMTDVEKLLVLHDYLVLNCAYDYENLLNNTLPDSVFTAYGALVDGVAVCNGYALAYADMLKYLGMRCYILASHDHAWNLVYVDGNWYHIDSTWDDPVSVTMDNYDQEGFVSHEFFLLSDTELRKLDTSSHGSWWIQASSVAVPAATHSGSYPGYIFREEALYTTATYYNGEWYYIADNYGGIWSDYIVKSKIDGSGATILDSLGYADYAQVEGDYLYYSREEDLYTDGIYAVKLGGTLKPERIMTMAGGRSYSGYRVEEFAVYNNILATLLINENNPNQWVRLEYLTSRRETMPFPTLKLSGAYLNYPGGINSLNTEDLSVKLVYSDGTKLDVDHTVSVSYAEAGIYNLKVSWKGLTASKQITNNSLWPIQDVFSHESNWIYNAAKYTYDKGYMSGTSATTFEPNKKMERSMFAQILYSMEGKPSVSFSEQFDDVPAGQWYSNAVTWAYQNGIVSGYSEEQFGTFDYVTRQQLALMLKKYAEMQGIDTSARADISGFADVDTISSYAVEAIRWAVAEGVMAGSGENLNPLGNATRAEGAAMIRSFCEKVKNQE